MRSLTESYSTIYARGTVWSSAQSLCAALRRSNTLQIIRETAATGSVIIEGDTTAEGQFPSLSDN